MRPEGAAGGQAGDASRPTPDLDEDRKVAVVARGSTPRLVTVKQRMLIVAGIVALVGVVPDVVRADWEVTGSEKGDCVSFALTADPVLSTTKDRHAIICKLYGSIANQPAVGATSLGYTSVIPFIGSYGGDVHKAYGECGGAHYSGAAYMGPITGSPYGDIPADYIVVEQANTPDACDGIADASGDPFPHSFEEGPHTMYGCLGNGAGLATSCASGTAINWKSSQTFGALGRLDMHAYLGTYTTRAVAGAAIWPMLLDLDTPGPCEAWSWSYEPDLTDPVFLESGTFVLTGTRSSDAAEYYPGGFFFQYDRTDGTRWKTIVQDAVPELSIVLEVPVGPGGTWSDAVKMLCMYDPPGDDWYGNSFQWRLGEPGGSPEGDRPCAWLGVTFPSSTTDTSEEITVRVKYAPPSWAIVTAGGVTGLEVGRQTASSTWTDQSVDDDWWQPGTGPISDPLPLETAGGWLFVTTDLTGGSLEDETGRWSVVCEDGEGEFRIRAPTVGTVTPPAGSADPRGPSDTWPDPNVTVPGGGNSGAGPGGPGSGPDDGGGSGTGPGSDGVGGDGFGFGGGNCFQSIDADWWNPFSFTGGTIQWALSAGRCILVGLFVPDSSSWQGMVDELSGLVQEEFPFSWFYMLVDVVDAFGNAAVISADGGGASIPVPMDCDLLTGGQICADSEAPTPQLLTGQNREYVWGIICLGLTGVLLAMGWEMIRFDRTESLYVNYEHYAPL